MMSLQKKAHEYGSIFESMGVKNQKVRDNLGLMLAQQIKLPFEKFIEYSEAVHDRIEKGLRIKDIDYAKEFTEAVTSNDMASWLQIVIPMMSRAFPAMIGPQVMGFQPLDKSPNGQIFFSKRKYTNDSDYPIAPLKDVKIIWVDPSFHSDIETAYTLENDNYLINVDADPTHTTPAKKYTNSGYIRYMEDESKGVYLIDTMGAVSPDTTPIYSAGDVLIISNDGGTTWSYVTVSGNKATIVAETDGSIGFKHVFKKYADYVKAGILKEEQTTDMKELGLEIESKNISAKLKQLKIKWSKVVDEDLRRVFGIDADDIFSETGHEELAMEYNADAMHHIVAAAQLGGINVFDYSSADGVWEIQKYQNLVAKLNRLSAEILKANYFGAGNFLIMSPIVFAALDSTGMIDKSMLPGGIDNPLADPFSGILNGKFRVYQDIYSDEIAIYMGYKDFSDSPVANMRAGHIISIYSGVNEIKLYGEESGNPRKIFSTRYCITENPFGAENFYRKLQLTNMPL